MSDDFDKDMPWLDDDDDGSDGTDDSGLDLDWLKDDGVELSDLPQTGDLSMELDWMTDGDDESSSSPGEPRSGVTGQLSWMRSAGDDDSPASFGDDDDVPDVDWGTGGDDNDDSPIGSRSTGVTGQLSWIDQTEEEFEEQLDAAEEAAAEADSFLDMDDDPSAEAFDDSLPEWLRGAAMDFEDEDDDLDPPEPEISKLSTAELESLDLPEWLQSPDDGLPYDERTAPEASGSWSPPAEAADQSAAFVDDMAAFDAESPLEPTSGDLPATGDLPDWLSDDADDASSPAFDVADENPVSDGDDDTFISATLPQTGDLPDWLTADDDDAQADAPAFAADENDTFASSDAALPQTGDLPDWLTSDDSGETAEDDMPEWMQDVSSEQSSDEAAAFSASDMVSDDMPQTGELTWMQDLDADDNTDEYEEDAEAESFEQFDADEAFAEFDDDDIAFENDKYEEDFDDEDLELEAMFGADLDDAVGEDELDTLLEDADASDLVPGFDDMFSDEAFDVAEDDEFDLLGEMTAESTGLTGMLGGGDHDDAFDLLNELDGGDDDGFDLLGELAGDDAQDEPDQETPIADMVADDDTFLEEAQAFAATVEQDDAPDSDDDLGGLLDDELLLAELDDDGLLADLDTGDLDGLLDEVEEDEEEAFRWFDESDQQPAMPDMDSEDMEWLEDIRPDDLREPDAAAVDDLMDEPMAMFDEPPKFGNVDEYIASLDEENFSLPTTGELQSSNLGVDFDALLDDEALSALDYDTGLEAAIPPELAPDAPEWLSDLSQQAGDANSAAAIVRRRQDRPVEELDDRLRDLRERGLNLKSDDTPEESEILEQVLPGVKNTLPAISQQHIVQPTTVTQINLDPDQVAQAMLLKELSGQRDEDTVAEGSRVRRLLTDRVVIGVLLLLVMIVPFFVSDINIGDLPPNTFAAGSHQMAFFDAVDDLSPGDQVLIAVEFGSAGAAELDDSTEALLRHTLARGAVPVIVSSNPIGLLRIDTRMRDIAEENALTANVDYVVGTYLVADVVGLRNFAENIDLYVSTDARGEPTGIDIDSLDVFSLIVVVSETSERVRAWGEQIAPIADAPLVAVTGAGAMPLSEPYLAANSDVISGYLVGYADGYTYRAMLNRLLTGGTIDIPPTETPPPTDEPTTVPADGAGTDAETTEEPSEIELTAAIVITEAPTNTPAVTETPAATETPAISPTPSVTNTPEPTDTPIPTNTPTLTPTPTPEPIRVITVTTDGAVNIRPDASTSNPPVGVIPAGGEAVVINEQENDIGELWYNIRFFDISGDVVDGWIRSDLVDIATVDELPEGLPEPGPADNDESAKQAIFSKQVAPLFAPPHRMQDDATPTPAPEDIDVTLTAAAEIVPDEMASTLTAAPMTLTAVAETAESALDITPTIQVTPDASQEQQEGVAAPEETDEATIAAEEPEIVNAADLPRQIAPMDDNLRDERWYSMTLGIAFAVIVIAVGNLFNVVRAARRRRND